MKAITYYNYGSSEVLHQVEMPKPTPQANEILVKIHASTVTPVDCSFRSADPFIVRFFTGLFRPKMPVLGTELAGEIVAVGRDVRRFSIGEHIFAALADGRGAHSEYICLPEQGAQVTLPRNMDFAQAATLCNGALTALPFLRDSGKIQSGQRVLINGASGSIGIAAVQLAKYFGAHVTGVCSGAKLDFVRELGADKVIDYTREDFCKNDQPYDIVFDTVGKSSFSASKQVLTPHGVYLSTVITCETFFMMMWTGLRNGKKARLSATGLRSAPDQIKDMEMIKSLVEDGVLTAEIDRTYALAQIAQAHRYVETGHKRGNVVIQIA